MFYTFTNVCLLLSYGLLNRWSDIDIIWREDLLHSGENIDYIQSQNSAPKGWLTQEI